MDNLFISIYNIYNIIESQLEGAGARHTFCVDSRGRPSQSSVSPKALPCPPLGHGRSVTSSMCNAVDFCLYAARFVVGALCRADCLLYETILIVRYCVELLIFKQPACLHSRGAGIWVGHSAGGVITT